MSSERPYFLVLESEAYDGFLHDVIESLNIQKRVIGVTNLEEAQSILDKSDPDERPDILIFDWDALTIIDRLEYLKNLRANGSPYKDAPIFLLTTDTKNALLLETLSLGCEIEQKPFEISQFHRRIVERLNETQNKAA